MYADNGGMCRGNVGGGGFHIGGVVFESGYLNKRKSACLSIRWRGNRGQEYCSFYQEYQGMSRAYMDDFGY